MHALFYRIVHAISSTRWFGRVGPYVFPHLDRVVHRATGGKLLVSSLVQPGLVLTSTGARSGLPRESPLASLADEKGWLVVGSNFGQDGHPAWTYNLIAHPDATISWQGEDVPVTARLLEGAERKEAWAELLAFYPPYAVYASRVDREIRLFRLVRRAIP
ncbi:MAG: nitroreductase family deazaflavin-dependent oxidoreductase [Nocardioides sp.]|nr:nitroreductase family deazaflavin-dependent oxidoreductase [Nocardioides sp.]